MKYYIKGLSILNTSTYDKNDKLENWLGTKTEFRLLVK